MNEFSERYKSYSNSKLLQIIELQADYQELAVEAARAELSNRNLTDSAIQDAVEELAFISRKKELETKSKSQRLHNSEKKISGALDILNPTNPENQMAHRIITIVSVIYGVIACISLYTSYFTVQEIVYAPSLVFGDLVAVMPLLLQPFAVLFFLFKLKVGWYMMASIISWKFINALGLLYALWYFEASSFPDVNSLFPAALSNTYFISAFFFVATLWTLCLERVRELFKVSRNLMLLTILGTIIFTSIFIIKHYIKALI